MRFKSEKIDVPDNDPFENDVLSRKIHVENLSTLLTNISSPISLSINARWGQGKTTFIEMLDVSLRVRGEQTVHFSAWHSDFSSDPLVVFLGEMNEKLKILTEGDRDKGEAWETAKKAGVHLLKKGLPSLIKVGTAGIVDIDDLAEQEATNLLSSLTKDLIENYEQEKKSIEQFKKSVAKTLTNENDETSKLFVIIDELDRCRPTYAIELLERIKHLFDIPGLVFILAVDREQLAHSIKAVYGSNFESNGYLKRFIDIEYSLPEAELDDFINAQFESYGFDVFFKDRLEFREFQYDSGYLKDAIAMVFKYATYTLREVEQFFAKLNLVVKATPRNVYIYPSLLVFLLFLKDKYPPIYSNYIRDGQTPSEAISLLRGLAPKNIRLDSFEFRLMEGYLIAAKRSRHEQLLIAELDEHKLTLKDNDAPQDERAYAEAVLNVQVELTRMRGIALPDLVERIEMLKNFNFE